VTDHIVIGDIRPRVQYTADGTQTAFTYPFPIFAPADLKVYLGEALQAAGFAVDGAGQSAGGNVTFAAAPAAGTRVTLVRALAIARTTDFQEGGAFRAKTLNDELDRQTAFIQEVGERIERAIVAAPTESAAPLVLPPPALRANAYLGFDAAGTPIASPGTPPAPFSAALTPFVQAPTLTAARQILGALGNERLAKAAAYTVANADKAKTIACAGAPWTLTFDTPLAYDADFAVLVLGENDTRAIKIHFNTGGADFWLYPKQTALIFRQGSGWYIVRPERWRLSTGLAIHVDPTAGSDANDGLAAGPGNALATFVAARDIVCRVLDFNGQLVTIKYADGTHSVPIVIGATHNWVGGGQMRIEGNVTTPSSCILNVTNSDAIQIEGRKAGPVLLRGFKITTNGAGNGVNLSGGAWAQLENGLDFAATAYGHIYLGGSSMLQLVGNYAISGGASLHFTVDQSSFVSVVGSIGITLTGSPAFANQFARCLENSYLHLVGASFSGTAVGMRYLAQYNGVIQTGGGGANFLPGTSAGVASNGGQYV
jgi:hypothetical protein